MRTKKQEPEEFSVRWWLEGAITPVLFIGFLAALDMLLYAVM